MKTIHLSPIGGLGNRLRTIASVYNYCVSNDAKLVVHWFKECRKDGLNASFCSLFKPVEAFTVVDCRFADYWVNNLPLKRNLYIPLLVDAVTRRRALYNIGKDELGQLEIDGDATVVTGSQQGEMCRLDKLFVPVAELRDEIDTFGTRLGENVVGCHIRRTDNVLSIKNSSIEKFEKCLDELFEGDDGVKVFLCSDDEEVKQHFVLRYGSNKVVTRRSVLKRNSWQGIADAVVEMWILSKARVIYGSYWSSFSEVSAYLGHSKLQVVK